MCKMETTNSKVISKKGTWMTYRPDVKVLDCTIRDGGLINKFGFKDEFVKAVYQACIEAGVDYMEMGYKTSKKIAAKSEFGVWKFCEEEDIRKIVGENPSTLKLSVMADAERTDYHEDILPKNQSVIDMVRVATYVHQIPTAIDMIKDAHDKGYETTINIMAISQLKESDLDEALEILSNTEVEVIYVVDSFGSLYSEDIHKLTSKYLKYAQDSGKKIGIHAHNNQQLAYANTIEAIILGTSFVDATIAGLGRGAGNCPMELILGFLKNPKYHLRPILECVERHIPALRSHVSWGFDIPYMLTGQLNQHPRSAIGFLSEQRYDYTNFYDSIVNGD